jgi:drug/metabolite transporter (DMT)-like permease
MPLQRNIAIRKRHSSRLAVLALIALTSIWGYNWVAMKECLKYAGVYDFAALRTGIAAAGLFALLIWKRRPLRPKALGMTILLGLLSTTACIGLVTLALATGGAGIHSPAADRIRDRGRARETVTTVVPMGRALPCTPRPA